MAQRKISFAIIFFSLCLCFAQAKAADGYCGDNYKTSGSDAFKINAFHAFDGNNLVVACDGGTAYTSEPQTILTSNDGGKTWTNRLNLKDSSIGKFNFLDNKTGFAVGAHFPASDICEGLILKTTDGGLSWKNIPADISECLEDIQFIDRQTGWIATDKGSFYKTSDGGNTWTIVNQKPLTKKELFFINSSFLENNTGWTITREREFINDKKDVIIDGDIYQTQDGGKTWRSRKEYFISLLQQWRPTEIRFQAIKFLDLKRGYVAAHFEQMQQKPDDGNRYIIYRGGVIFSTQNGGETWETKIITTDLGLNFASFSTNGKFWIIPVKVWQTEFIYSSIDFGKSWKKRSTKFTDGGKPSKIYFVNDKTGFMIADLGNNADDLYRTSNGGKTWRLR